MPTRVVVWVGSMVVTMLGDGAVDGHGLAHCGYGNGIPLLMGCTAAPSALLTFSGTRRR